MSYRTAKSQGGVSENYSFDTIDQVTGVNYGGMRNVSYDYDSVGNRTSVVDNAVTTNLKHASADYFPLAGQLAGYLAEANQLVNGYINPSTRSADLGADNRGSAWDRNDFISNAVGDYYGSTGKMPKGLK